MSQSVNQLKELLFDKEHRELGDLQTRLVAIAENERQAREVLQARIDEIIAGVTERQNRLDELYQRTGSEERLRSSVAQVIGGALVQVDTDTEKSADLRKAMIPFVASTVKTEIRNNHDTLVQVLEPSIIGMVRNAITSAMNDMMIQINRKLEKAMPGHGSRMRAKAKAAGMTMAEMAMAETQKLQVEEIYLIRRGAGQVIGHWIRSTPDHAGGQVLSGSHDSTELVELTPVTRMPDARQDALVGSFLAAMTEFSKETFEDDNSSLRSLELDGFRIYLRRSPVFLLAAKCSGTPLPGIDQVIDTQFQTLMTEHDDLLSQLESRKKLNGDTAGAGEQIDGGPINPVQILSQAASSIETQVSSRHDKLFSQEEKGSGGGGVNPLKLLTLLIGLPLIAWLAWSYWQDYLTARTRDRTQQTISSIAGMRGYPVNIGVSSGGKTVRLSGLAPTNPVKQQVISDLGAALPGIEIRDEISILPITKAIDTRPEFAAVRRELSQTAARNRDALAQRADSITARQRQLLDQTERNQNKLVELAALNEKKLAALELQFTRDGLTRAMERTGNRLRAVSSELGDLRILLANRLALNSGSEAGNERVSQLIAELDPVLQKLEALNARQDELDKTMTTGATLDAGLSANLNAIRVEINQIGGDLAAMVKQRTDANVTAAADRSPDGQNTSKPLARAEDQSALESAEEVALAAERLRGEASHASRIALLAPVERSVGKVSSSLNTLQRRVAGLAPSIRERLESWTRSNAVFFSQGANFRPRARDRVRRKLDRLAELMRKSGIHVRVIGYTDATGQQTRNAPLAVARAAKVAKELLSRGVPAGQIVVVGRTNGPDLAVGTGSSSANRRVQFETAFTDEVVGGR